MLLIELFEDLKHDLKRSRIQEMLDGQYPIASAALSYAAEFHVGLRKDGVTPEFDHQVSIVRFMLKLTPHLMFPDETLAVGFLHDVSEDYKVRFGDLSSQFGRRVGRGVNLVTKKFDKVERREDKLFQLMAKDPIASIAKGCDRIHNQSTMKPFTADKKNSYLDFTGDMIIPMLLEAKKNFPTQGPAYDTILRVLGYQDKSHRTRATY